MRALAILSVILFHAGFETFDGGFVGVDIFFVISGYLIATITLAELESGKFSIANFYERRARRLLPALFLVMLACIPFAWFWMSPSDMKDFSQSLVALSVFASNILFWLKSGYFDPAAEIKPLLHTWSLAVEAQYYMLFPLLLMLFWRLDRHWMLVAIGVVSAVSLALAQWAVHAKPTAAFYLLPTRSWELLVGALVALCLPKAHPEGFSKGAGEVGSWLGVALIAYSIFAYSESTPFPGLYALVPTTGAVLFIVFSNQQITAGKFFGNRIFVGIGLVSYSVYLWHQPIFAFIKTKSVTKPSGTTFSLLLALVFLLAYLTWKFVEIPFRKKDLYSRRFIFFFGTAGAAFFMVLGFIGHKTDGFSRYYYEHRADPRGKELRRYLEYSKTSEFKSAYRYKTCFDGINFNSFDPLDKDSCLYISPNKKNFLILGDSHSAHLAEAFRSNYSDFNFLQVSESGCRPVVPLSGEQRCINMIKFMFDKFIPSNNLDGIILAARWTDIDVESLKSSVGRLLKYVPMVWVIGPTVEYKPALPTILADLNLYTERESSKVLCFVDFNRLVLSKNLENILVKAGATYVPIHREICSESRCVVRTDSGVPISWDYGHYTKDGASFLLHRLISNGTLKLL